MLWWMKRGFPMALAFKRMQAKRHTANTQHHLSQCHIYTEHTGILALSHSQIEKHPVDPFLHRHHLFVFSISDWFPLVLQSRCMAAVRCVSCYSKPWLVHLSLAGQTQKKIWNTANFTGMRKSIAFKVQVHVEILNTSCTMHRCWQLPPSFPRLADQSEHQTMMLSFLILLYYLLDTSLLAILEVLTKVWLYHCMPTKQPFGLQLQNK